MSRFVDRYGDTHVRLDPWDTLDDLRELIGVRCSPARFDAAVEIMGRDAYSVANYLCRHGYVVAESHG
jgi:hypothetical protein